MGAGGRDECGQDTLTPNQAVIPPCLLRHLSPVDHSHNMACKVLREESLLGLARCKLTLTLYQDCIDACKLVLASTSEWNVQTCVAKGSNCCALDMPCYSAMLAPVTKLLMFNCHLVCCCHTDDPERQSRARCAFGQALFATREYTAAVRQLEQAAAVSDPSVREAASAALHEARLAMCSSSLRAAGPTLVPPSAASVIPAEALESARRFIKRGRVQRVKADFAAAANLYAVAAVTLEGALEFEVE